MEKVGEGMEKGQVGREMKKILKKNPKMRKEN